MHMLPEGLCHPWWLPLRAVCLTVIASEHAGGHRRRCVMWQCCASAEFR